MSDVRCGRIGSLVTLGPDGLCPECGSRSHATPESRDRLDIAADRARALEMFAGRCILGLLAEVRVMRDRIEALERRDRDRV